MQDITGNVWEWVADWLDVEAYKKLGPTPKDPPGPDQGESKIFRGGSFMNGANEITTTLRDREKPTFVDSSIGFRCGY
jgi:formylglycine-generating enzyme required for sulfatase activity